MELYPPAEEKEEDKKEVRGKRHKYFRETYMMGNILCAVSGQLRTEWPFALQLILHTKNFWQICLGSGCALHPYNPTSSICWHLVPEPMSSSAYPMQEIVLEAHGAIVYVSAIQGDEGEDDEEAQGEAPEVTEWREAGFRLINRGSVAVISIAGGYASWGIHAIHYSSGCMVSWVPLMFHMRSNMARAMVHYLYHSRHASSAMCAAMCCHPAVVAQRDSPLTCSMVQACTHGS
jgi:hypothetical protein